MPRDERRDKLWWRNRKANHMSRPTRGRRCSEFKFGNRPKRGK